MIICEQLHYLEYDALLVNPIREGMNLVAQEGPLINRRHGVLLLSTQAGAHDRLRGPAIEVSPLDVSCTASALRRAMLMKQAKRKRRAELLHERVLAGAGKPLARTTRCDCQKQPGPLVLPAESWDLRRCRCRAAGIPEGTVFAMKPKLGRRMIARTRTPGRSPVGRPAMRCTATSPSPRSSRSPADGGPSKTDSHAGRDWPTSMSTRSAARTPGITGSPWPCSPPRSCITAAAEHATGPPPTARSRSSVTRSAACSPP